jgi:pimeloyl-ACP methyl ester carboxylesterase
MTWTRSGRAKTSALLGALALTVFAGAKGLSRSASSTLTPPIGEFVLVNGKQVHYHLSGPENAPAVVLIHGASGNLRDFTYSLAPELAKEFRVLVFDRPGLGYSENLHASGESPQEQARHLADATIKIGVEHAVLVGHSYGAAVAMAWALERPDQAAGLVSLGGVLNPWPGGLGAWYDITGSWLGGLTIVPLIATFATKGMAEKSVESIFEPDPIPDEYLDYVGSDLTLRSKVLRTNARQVGGLRPYMVELSQQYERLELPIEALHGSADTIVPLSIHSQPLSERLTNVNLTVLGGVGHMPHHANQSATIIAIKRATYRAGLRD